MKTKMTLETIDGRYSVETDVGRDGCLPELVEDVIKPLLLAAGYAQYSIDEQFCSDKALEPERV